MKTVLSIRSVLAFSLVVSALALPNAGWAGGGSCKVVVAADPSKGVHLVMDAKESDQIFAAARQKFLNEMADGKEYESIFKMLAKGEKPKKPKKTLDQLKDFRKFGIRLRSDFVVLADDHEVPKAFEKFVKKLGHLNDALEFNAWKKVPGEAKDVLKAYRVAEITANLNGFKAAAPESIIHEINQLRVEILALVEQPHCTVHQFHDTRKSLKHLLSIVQAFNEESPTPEFTNAYEFLVAVNDQLGDLRQDVLEEELTSKSKKTDHDDDIQDLPDSVKTSVRAFLGALKADVAS